MRRRSDAKVESMSPSTGSRTKTDDASRVVLVVDDDEKQLAALARGDHAGVRMVTARTVDDALKQASAITPEVAIVDLRLGKDSGIDLIRELKQAHPEMTIVLCSAYMSVVSAVAAVRAGADDIVQKPVSLPEVLRRVEQEQIDPAVASDDTPTLARMEWEYMMRVLDDCEGNVSEAARRLGIYRSTLKRRLRRLAPE